MAGNRSRSGRIKGAVAGLSSPMPQVSLGSPRPASVALHGSVAENRRVQAGLPQDRSQALMWGVRPSTLGAVRRGETRDDRSSSDEDEVIDELEFGECTHRGVKKGGRVCWQKGKGSGSLVRCNGAWASMAHRIAGYRPAIFEAGGC